jgi:hypothetical protein
MIELALLVGLGTLGYVLASKQKQEGFELRQPQMPDIQSKEYVPEPEQDPTKGHSNETPFFGSHVTQSMYSGSTNSLLDTHTGAGNEYFQKREVKSLFDAKAGTQNPFGAAVETDFLQSRMVTGQRMNNVFPIEPVQVGPGVNDGYTNIPKGGFQQADIREYAMPKTTDEIRVVGQEKLSHEQPMIAGVAMVTQPGLQAEVKKNRPDKFQVLGMDRANTAVGAQTAPRVYPDHSLKEQARETTYNVQTAPAAPGTTTFTSYIRSFTEPFQEFMKLTAEGRPNPGGPIGETSIGAAQYAVQSKYDMDSMLTGSTRLNVPLQVLNSSSEHMGSYRYNQPLQQDVNMERNNSSILDALSANPYAQKLTSF